MPTRKTRKAFGSTKPEGQPEYVADVPVGIKVYAKGKDVEEDEIFIAPAKFENEEK